MNQLIVDGLRSKIFKIDEDNSVEKSICKVPRNTNKNVQSELFNEYEVTSQLNIQGIRKPLHKGIFENKSAFFYAYFEGITLKQFVTDKLVSPKEFFTIALNLLKTLKSIHHNGYFHLRINSNNILVNPETFETLIIDFTLATNTTENKTLNFNEWGEELAYIAPEQTGQFLKTVDNRTDLYSLGIVLYELWSGKLPFTNNRTSDIVHSHLVKIPPYLNKIRTDTPDFISEIIAKLLEKNPDARYQTSTGLEMDLNECFHFFETGKTNTQFKPGRMDFSGKLNLSQKIYGRDQELRLLNESLERVKQGGKETIFISGPTGVGKTLLIQEFYKRKAADSVLVLSGSFDELKSDMPYQAIIQAFGELATHVLSKSEQELREWREILNEAVDEIGQLLIDLIPEFKWILNEQKPIPELNAVQLESRINFLFYRLLKGIANPICPVVFVIDNFHKSDSSSLKIIKTLIEENDIENVVFIFKYETPTKIETQEFKDRFTEVLEVPPEKKELFVQNFTYEDVLLFLKDSLETNDIEELAKITYKKTLGNPYFIHRFLHSIYNKKELVFDPVLNQWEWDVEKLESFQLAKNAIEYMAGKVKNLKDNELLVLKQVACFESNFSLNYLAELTHLPLKELNSVIAVLVNLEIIVKRKGDYQFAHESIRDSVYKLLSKKEKSLWHYKIFELLQKEFASNKENSKLFLLVRHLSEGFKNIQEEGKFEKVLLFHEASKIARRTVSFELSFKYSKRSISLLKESDWHQHYEIVLEIFNQAAEMGMIAGEFETAEEYLKKSLDNAKNFNDRIKAHEIKITHLSETHQFPETVNYLLKVLDEIGYGIKRNPGKLEILKEYLMVKFQFLGKSPEDILNLPENNNDRAKAFIKLTVMAGVALFGSAPDILPIVNFRQTRLSLKYGNTEYSPYSYSAYGFAITAFMNDVAKGYDLAKMSLRLVERNKSEVIKAKVMVVFYAFLAYWKDSLLESAEPLKEAYLTGRQTGDLLYASFAALFYNQIRLFAGHNLGELLESLTNDCNTIKNLNQDLVYIISECQRQFVYSLVKKVDEPWVLQHDGFNEDAFLSKLEQLNDEASKFDVYFFKLSLACLFNEYDIGFTNSEFARKYEEETTARQVPYPTYLFFSAMSVIKGDMQKNRSLSERNRKIAVKKIKLLKGYARHAPQNYENKYNFLEALMLETSGKIAESTEKFQQAISLSEKSGFIHEEAIAREHFAYFLLKTGQIEFGELMLEKAFQCYKDWGAKNKCRQLTEKYPSIFNRLEKEKSDTTISGIQNIYDLNTIIKSTRILSSEQTFDGLLGKMVELVISNASCTKVVIALKNNNEGLIPYALGTNEKITVYSENKNSDKPEYPSSVIHFVSHSKTEFTSPNLKKDKRYKFDNYVKAHSPVSVCCIPIVSKEVFLGVIYFENILTEHAFDNERIEFFKTLAAQLAISLDNVMLYSQMEQKVKDRTSELVVKNEELTNEKRKSDNLLLNILPAETAEELKNEGKTTAKRYESASILFADIKNFSIISEKLSAEELVSELDICFKKFDEIIERNGLEKIKTIGDAYMAVGGLPDNNSATAADVVRSALQMQDFIKLHSEKRINQGKPNFKIRIGINTGPVVAGVVGTKKFQFDIWGNAVNVAARMEQHGEPGKVNISQTTYEMVKSKFNCHHRGKITAKNIGLTEMYFVDYL